MKEVKAYESADGKLFRTPSELHEDNLKTTGKSVQAEATLFKAKLKLLLEGEQSPHWRTAPTPLTPDAKRTVRKELRKITSDMRAVLDRAEAALDHIDNAEPQPGAQRLKPK